jgi:hypothetical protein
MSSQLKQAMTQSSAGPTDLFGVAYLQLCRISYDDTIGDTAIGGEFGDAIQSGRQMAMHMGTGDRS